MDLVGGQMWMGVQSVSPNKCSFFPNSHKQRKQKEKNIFFIYSLMKK
jgi:hypothetical protein